MSRRRVIAGLLLGVAACSAGGAGGEFDGPSGLGYVERQLAFGPRIPNTDGHRRTDDWLASGFILDCQDREEEEEIKVTGLRTLVTVTVMNTPLDRQRLAMEVLRFAQQ